MINDFENFPSILFEMQLSKEDRIIVGVNPYLEITTAIVNKHLSTMFIDQIYDQEVKSNE